MPAHKIVAGLLKQNNHRLTRMKSNAVAYTAYQQRGPRKRGRPRVYGRKIKLSSLLQASRDFQPAPSPVYGENKVIIQYRVRDLLWHPAGRLVRFVAVIHPARGACLLMCTDTSLDAIDIIRLYGLRFKIEHTFKQAVRQIGPFTYHFWMSDMRPLRRNSGNQHLHRTSLEYRNTVKRKLHAYHVFIQTGIICQGLLQYLAVAHPRLVWSSFGSWLRTIRPGIPPSELVVAIALRHSLPEFLLNLFRDIFPAARCVLLICFLSTTNTPQLVAGIFYWKHDDHFVPRCDLFFRKLAQSDGLLDRAPPSQDCDIAPHG